MNSAASDPASWFLVSKPLRRPFADGSSVLVKTLLQASADDRHFAYFGDPQAPVRATGLDTVIAKSAMGHAPSLRAKVGVLAELLRPRHRERPLHFFFTPNPVTSNVLRLLRRLDPQRPVVQSIMSSTQVERFAPLLTELDAVIVLSDHTRQRLIRAGLDAARVHRIYPGVPLPDPSPPPHNMRRRAIYAGDLDLDTARRLVAFAHAAQRPSAQAWTLVIACRPKSDADARAREYLRRELAAPIAAGKVEVHGHVDDFEALLAGCTCQLYLADHVHKKVDIPLTLLEGLARGLGLIALDFAPLDELFARAEAHGLDIGRSIDPRLSGAALEEALFDALPTAAQAAIWRADGARLVKLEFSASALASAHAALYQRCHARHR